MIDTWRDVEKEKDQFPLSYEIAEKVYDIINGSMSENSMTNSEYVEVYKFIKEKLNK